MSNYTEKIQAGIKLLDEKQPGWKSSIDVDSLDLGDCGVCVLGQVFGDYSSGLEELGITAGSRYGFDSSNGGSFSELTKAWVEALGENKVLVEKGDVYKDAYGYAVKILQTHLITVGGENMSVYIVEMGSIKGTVFTASVREPGLLQKKHFEKGGAYPVKVEEFQVKQGMFLTNDNGQVFYATSNFEVREIKEGARSSWLSEIEKTGLRELTTMAGDKFSDKLVK